MNFTSNYFYFNFTVLLFKLNNFFNYKTKLK